MLSNKNNLRSELTANVGVLATSISITAGEGVLWENNMVACLEHYENDICTKREVIKITAKNNDTFTITRGFADCIMNDQTKQQGHGSQEFVVGDYLSLYLSKEIWESLTVGITTNETNIQTMVARINAPKTCINNNCQDWKDAIDTAYVTKFGGVAGFGTGADGDVVISQDTFLDAGCEYNFNNLTILEGVTVRFCGIGTPTINVWKDFRNCGVLDMRAPYLEARTCKQTDCWLHKGTELCNQCESLSGIASEGGLYCGGAGGCGASSGCGASDGHGGNGGSGGLYDGCNGGDGGTSGCLGTGGGGGFGVGKGGNGGAGTCNGGNGGNGYYGGQGGDKTGNVSSGGGGAGGVGVVRGGDAGGGRGSLDYTTMGNGGDAITNVYGLHLNARNIYNKCVNSRGGDGGNGGLYCWTGTSGGDTPSGGNGGNGANGGQILVSYDCMYEQGCFDVSGGKGGEGGKIKFTSESYWRYEQPNGTDGTAGWVVFRNLNNPYIQNFNLVNDEDNEAILISWKDPSFKPSNPQQWAKTVVRYSTSNYPTTPTDGTLAVEETTRDQYETTPYSLTGVLDETTYYFTAFAIDQNNDIIDSQTSSITTDFGWHVTPNTLFYIKNDGEITDHSQYNHAMQRYGTSAFATLSNGRKVLDLSGNNFTFSNQFTEANNKTQFTLHLRIKLKSGNPNEIVYGGWTGRNKSSTGTSDRWGARFQSDSAGNKSYILAGPNSTSRINTETGGNLYTNIGTSEFALLSATINGGTYKLYKNGSLVGTYSSSTIRGGSSTGPRFYLGGCVYPDGTLRLAGLLAYIGESDLENKVQTDAEVLQFYNKTKKHYI